MYGLRLEPFSTVTNVRLFSSHLHGYTQGLALTPFMVLSITYYLELLNAITSNCLIHFLLAKVQKVVWTL